MPETADIEKFIERWMSAGGGERSNYQLFLSELCALLGAPGPDPAVEDESQNVYVFERKVHSTRMDGTSSVNFIDLYKRGCFVLEAKQSAKRLRQFEALRRMDGEIPNFRIGSGRRGGAQWDTVMRNARQQAETYARNLPPEEGWPPFLIVVDVGHVIELYADFSLQGKHYAQFPDRRSYRVYLDDLRKPEIRALLADIWTNPMSRNPAQRTAEVTRDIADLLAQVSTMLETRMLGASVESASPAPPVLETRIPETRIPETRIPETRIREKRAIAEKVSLFLMRCLFTMFAEDVGLLKKASFAGLLRDYKGQAENLHIALSRLWRDMDRGGFAPDLRVDVLRFNGGLFKDADALPITEDDLCLLTIAASRDWKDVEPAIFGTLLESALDSRERHQLGAHYTPRAYVERLVAPTIIDPLTEDWRNVQTAAAQFMEKGEVDKAQNVVREYHRALCEVRVLDPACGTGNFLYVSMELMKRLEGEVLETLADLGEAQYFLEMDRHTVDPHQFLGLEINPRAVAIAELVLWIGYLQWHFRTRGRAMPTEPVLKNFANIVEQDAVVAYDGWDVLRDEDGEPVTRWDGVTYTRHPVTGAEIPDETARVALRRYLNPRPAAWPKADFIVGNPPFIGGKDLRRELGDGYAEAVWLARKHIPGGADFVMQFWDKAAAEVAAGRTRRFGFITTNSITQSFSRRVIETRLRGRRPLSLAMAIPDHPWMNSADKASVRIAMTVAVEGRRDGRLYRTIHEGHLNSDSPVVDFKSEWGRIHADFTIGPDISNVTPLASNQQLCSRGVSLHGGGFIVTATQAAQLGLGRIDGLESYIRPYRNGRDLAGRSREALVIDLFSLSEHDVRDRFPEVYQWVRDRVKPVRDNNNRQSYRDSWWVFGEPRRELRSVLEGVSRYIATVETAKHRWFQFLDTSVLPDNMLVNIGLDDAFFLGVLSSRIHCVWALASGGRLGVGNDSRYTKTRCFDPFPFPDSDRASDDTIRALGERLDAHRKMVLGRHEKLTMTGLYNVLEKANAGDALSDAEKIIYDDGLVGVLGSLQDDLNDAVAGAYGWPVDLEDAEILFRLAALNQVRAIAEQGGDVRWLRPAFQAPRDVAPLTPNEQFEATLGAPASSTKKQRFPRALPDQAAAIRKILETLEEAATPAAIAARFAQGRRVERQVSEVLRTLAILGQAEKTGDEYLLAC